MKWDVFVGPAKIRVEDESDSVEAATKAVEFLAATAGQFSIGAFIHVTSSNTREDLDAELILANAGLHYHAAKLRKAVLESTKKTKK